MPTIHLNATTTSTPEQFIAGLTDFGPGRAKLFGNSTDAYLKGYFQSPHDADVTERSGGIWERLHHDWSLPGRGAGGDFLRKAAYQEVPHDRSHLVERALEKELTAVGQVVLGIAANSARTRLVANPSTCAEARSCHCASSISQNTGC